MNIRKILNPVDGSAHAINATRYAAELSHFFHSEMLLLHCHRSFPKITAEPYFQKSIDRIIQASEELIAPFVEILEESGVLFETRILEGAAGMVIPNVAKINKVDMIVMGSRGCTDLEGLIVGSVAHKVLHSAACPVLIVK
ncbi:Nucleotide-binding universal stress protein, UspA family [Desulfocicer vacuolatum DSM 3385]|uniref:Nucleotide-binding universal stress protein, UspA family n=1 Tax=Desulfocicer vacuolatum DSM 3385 TaxID=1121400 RepID=A0A1W2E828_9BACT|nr:universal stress protein [Desulfocicer vacuolatum]SMD05929.1 Nucleotide-binding universal stress protein, UspA family [Desulfocicer vacuolatum DSM 3385]